MNGGGSGRYKATLRFDICDNFGVDENHVYNNPLNDPIAALRSFWVLQHERGFGTIKYRPFVDHVFVEVPIEGMFTIPKEFKDFKKSISGGQRSDHVSTVPGFGSDPVVYYRYQFASSLEIAGKMQPDSSPLSLVFPPNQFFTATFYQPATNRSATVASTTSPSGEVTLFADSPLSAGEGGSTVQFNQFGGKDSTGDGLPDIARYVLGLKVGVRSFAGDGIDDAAKLAMGLDPFDGRAFPSGVVAGVQLLAPAEAVASLGDAIYVADGNKGLAVVNGKQFNNPILQGQLSLPRAATDVDVDPSLQIAAVATGQALQLVNISDPLTPKLTMSVVADADRVRVANGFAYAVADSLLSVVDMLTGDVVARVTLPGSGQVTGLAREGSKLYAFFSGNRTLVVIDIAVPEGAAVRGQLRVDIASSNVGVFAGNNVVWLAGSGLQTVNVSDPAHPTLIHGADSFFNARQIALNGSGVGVLTPAGGNFVQIYDVSDPTKTNKFLTQFTTSGAARAVAISRGIAFVGESDRLEVVNYLPFDSKGVVPTAAISTPNLQVVENASLPIRADVHDDVQVRNVELLVNGQTVQNNVAFPFDFFVTAPKFTAPATTFTVQVRATDTGGNVGLSNVLTLTVVKDTVPPTIQSVTPADGATQPEGMRVLRIRFSKPLDAAGITRDNFKLYRAGASGKFDGTEMLVPLQDIQLRDNATLVQLTTDTLPRALYQLRVNRAAITDRAGNVLGTGTFTSSFKLVEVLLQNGGFETGDLSSWTSLPGRGGRIDVVRSHTGVGQGSYVYSPVEGTYFARLRTGDENVYTSLSQAMSVRTGDVLSGSSFFDTGDYLPFDDMSEVRILRDGVVVTTLFMASVHSVGDHGHTPWTHWQYMFTVPGTYVLEARLTNIGDNLVDSYLGLDGVALIHA